MPTQLSMTNIKPTIPTPVKVIDRILNALYHGQGLNYNDIKTKSGTLDDEDTERAILQLYTDGYIIVRDADIVIIHGNIRSCNYMISFSGVMHHLKGGYEGEIAKVFLEKNSNQQVITDQKKLAGRMNVLTFVLIVVALPAGLLALVDLYWKYKWFQFPFWWRVVGSNIVASALTSYAVWRLLQWKQQQKEKSQPK